jgi:hypothetical protein
MKIKIVKNKIIFLGGIMFTDFFYLNEILTLIEEDGKYRLTYEVNDLVTNKVCDGYWCVPFETKIEVLEHLSEYCEYVEIK